MTSRSLGSISDIAGQPDTSASSRNPTAEQVKSENQDAYQSGQPFVQASFSHLTAPTKQTPVKTTLKALPTVRDHTTNQLDSDRNEFIPREFDDAGEAKMLPNGELTGKRQYWCRTFLLANRGDKLFMLATECARTLGYRDSYLLFNKNRSLHKIISSQEEKDDLVAQSVLPLSYRSRQIAIVTARSIFRQFGSRVIMNGHRVRDDYWETKARKQGFTEQDLATDKRPGAAKAREAAAAAAAAAANASASKPSVHLVSPGDITYAPSGQVPAPSPILAPPDPNEARSRDLSGILKCPRQEITSPPFSDSTRPSPIAEIQSHSQHAAEFNRNLNQQREMRSEFVTRMWQKPHESASTMAMTQPNANDDVSGSGEPSLAADATLASASGQTPRTPYTNPVLKQSPRLLMMNSNVYSQQPVQSHASVSQGAVRALTRQPSRSPSQYVQPAGGRVATTNIGPGSAPVHGPGSYNYTSAGQIWQPQHHPHQPQTFHPSPPQLHQQQQHPPQQHPQQHHPQQQHPQHHQQIPQQNQLQPQPQHQPPPHQAFQGPFSGYATVQSPPSNSSASPQHLRHHPGGQIAAQFPGMPAIQGYGPQSGMYGDQTPRQYLPQGSPGQSAATQGWSGHQQAPLPHQWWQNQQ